MDHVSKEVRSKIMAAIRSRGNTTTELPLGETALGGGSQGYRKHWPVAGQARFRVAGTQGRCFRGRLFLARLPLQIPSAHQYGILAQ